MSHQDGKATPDNAVARQDRRAQKREKEEHERQVESWAVQRATWNARAMAPFDSATRRPTRRFVSEGANRVVDERFRQVEVEGYLPEHDEAHIDGELARAALVYLRRVCEPPLRIDDRPPGDWPWDASLWRPTDENPILMLSKAGALIAAEIDRLLGMGWERGR